MVPVDRLERLALLESADGADVAELARSLDAVTLAPGAALMRQDEPGTWFALVVEGDATITRASASGDRVIGHAGPGSVLGEVALIGHTTRSATVVARTEFHALVGDARAFAHLLGIAGVRHSFARTVAQRLATHAEPVRVPLRDGQHVVLRPSLPADRAILRSSLDSLSLESRRRRFFSGAPVTDHLVEYFVDIDYIDHFAWIVLQPDRRVDASVASARFIRRADQHDTAEVGFDVLDEVQRMGIGTILLGALGAAAQVSGVTNLEGSVLADNVAMRRVFNKAGAHWEHEEPGVVRAHVDVDRCVELVDASLARTLAAAAQRIVSVAGLALLA